jgi:hypothetical protein
MNKMICDEEEMVDVVIPHHPAPLPSEYTDRIKYSKYYYSDVIMSLIGVLQTWSAIWVLIDIFKLAQSAIIPKIVFSVATIGKYSLALTLISNNAFL